VPSVISSYDLYRIQLSNTHRVFWSYKIIKSRLRDNLPRSCIASSRWKWLHVSLVTQNRFTWLELTTHNFKTVVRKVYTSRFINQSLQRPSNSAIIPPNSSSAFYPALQLHNFRAQGQTDHKAFTAQATALDTVMGRFDMHSEKRTNAANVAKRCLSLSSFHC
jgi:hypothetical protein